MNVITRVAVLALLPWFLSTTYAEDKAKKPPKPKFTISKETTRVLEPLTSDGYIDYATAINQQLGRGVTSENNANVLFWQAHGPHPERATMPREFFRWLGIDAPPEDGEYFLNLGEYLRTHAKIEPQDRRFNTIFDQQSKASSRPWITAEYPDIAIWLKANEKPLEVVARGASRPKYFSPLVVPADKEGEPGGLIAVLLPAVQASRSFARALTARAMLHLGEGRVEAAWADLMTCHRLGRHLGRSATLIESLVGIAIDSMATHATLALIQHSKPNAKQAAAYLRDLDALPPPLKMAEMLNLTERYMFLDTTLLLARNGNQVLKDAGLGNQVAALLGGLGRAIDWDIALRNGNRWYDRLVRTMRIKDRREMLKAMHQIDLELKKLVERGMGLNALKDLLTGTNPGEKVGNVLIALLLPAVAAAKAAEDRADQMSRNLRVALALSAYHSDRGQYPEKLSELGPKYLKAVPGDLFTGRPLVYRLTRDGYLFYSFGLNGKDDGGRWHDDKPRGDDLRVRMQ